MSAVLCARVQPASPTTLRRQCRASSASGRDSELQRTRKDSSECILFVLSSLCTFYLILNLLAKIRLLPNALGSPCGTAVQSKLWAPRQGKEQRKDNLAEWLRRETRNLMGSPAQVRILRLSILLFFAPITSFNLRFEFK